MFKVCQTDFMHSVANTFNKRLFCKHYCLLDITIVLSAWIGVNNYLSSFCKKKMYVLSPERFQYCKGWKFESIAGLLNHKYQRWGFCDCFNKLNLRKWVKSNERRILIVTASPHNNINDYRGKNRCYEHFLIVCINGCSDRAYQILPVK